MPCCLSSRYADKQKCTYISRRGEKWVRWKVIISQNHLSLALPAPMIKRLETVFNRFMRLHIFFMTLFSLGLFFTSLDRVSLNFHFLPVSSPSPPFGLVKNYYHYLQLHWLCRKKKMSKNWEPHKMDWSWFRMHCEGLPCALCSAREPKSASHAFATDTFMHFLGCFLNNVRVIRHSGGERAAAFVPFHQCPVLSSYLIRPFSSFGASIFKLTTSNMKFHETRYAPCTLKSRNRSEF